MLVQVIFSLVSTAGIAFYLRFLVALCKERKLRPVGYWVRLRLGASENAHTEPKQRETDLPRAA